MSAQSAALPFDLTVTPRPPALSLRRRLRWMTVAVVALLLASAIAVTLVVREAATAADRRSGLHRAALHALQLELVAVEEESAIRAYLLTGDPAQLEQWQTARAAWPALYGQVVTDADLAEDPEAVRDQTEAVGRLHTRWEAMASRPPRVGAPAGETTLVSDIRADLGRLTDTALAGREHAIRTEQASRRGLLVAMGLLALGLALVVWSVVAATRRHVLSPLTALGTAAREVAAGRRTRSVSVSGPVEISAVADDVEAMRGQLLHRLVEQDRLLEALEQQGPAVKRLRAMLSPPVPTGLRDLEITSRCLAGEGVLTGDWYDVVPLSRGRVAVTVGDVAGHGTVPAVMALALKHALAGALVAGLPPDAAVASAAAVFDLTAGGDPRLPALASVFVTVLDPAAGRMTYVNAGHPPALVWPRPRSRYPSRLLPTGPVLCQLTVDDQWRQLSCPFPPTSTLAVYTDGLVEARAAGSDDEYGEPRLLDTLERARLERPGPDAGPIALDRMTAALFTDVLDHAGTIRDDATLLLARHLSPPAPRPRPAAGPARQAAV